MIELIAMSIAQSLLTAAEFARMPDPGHPQELVRGVVVDMPLPKPRHGKVCVKVSARLEAFASENNLGHVFGNDSGIVTERNPDSVRGPDVTFVSYAKIPPNASLDEYVTVAPDAVFEVRSASDRWRDVLAKVNEYLQFGVQVVYVFNPDTKRIHCYYQDRPDEILNSTDELTGIGPLAGWRVPVARFFE
jgi:Uma2 family endonuclease